ncbi:uncharacterized protein A1O5_03908 [Cladophialophora psammophila CBS 110553]|uniref:Alpha/beta hydrolase fold-3 domain-containing protein n=1 Tax=Cladophialophora psammophila CBS 110553 TaxID=1182543 RepID=W9X759_9EURO|nr:uncharacterized protein A1O5_03908 [Cladophialophora psammophila CBS 110553]EXJ72761.1 hypothetical protein A1O5_03908 [Cladophialophora psammophila CBS 110553]
MTAPPTADQALSAPIHQVSLLEKLDVFPGLLSLVGTAVYTAVAAPFRGDSGAHTYKQHISYAVVRKMMKRFSTLQLQYIGAPFSTIYEKWCKDAGVTPEFVTLKSGCKAFWVGDPSTANYVCVYYHGGGFSLDGDDTHIKFWHGVQNDLKANNVSIAFLFLEYSLVPHATYPKPIYEAIEAVKYVMEDLKRPASEIMLAGDSAGGNMCLGVLSQIMHPYSEFPELKLADGEKLKGIMAVAPWTSFNLDWESEKRNRHRDIVTTHAGGKWSGDYLAGQPTTPFAEPLTAPAEWWKDAKVEHFLVVSGGNEILHDSIGAWVEKYKSVNPDSITHVVGQNEAHIAPIIHLRFNDTAETEQGQAIKSWLKAKL